MYRFTIFFRQPDNPHHRSVWTPVKVDPLLNSTIGCTRYYGNIMGSHMGF